MKSLELILMLFLRALDPAGSALPASAFDLEQMADCRLVADGLHRRVETSPSIDAASLAVLAQVRDEALQGMIERVGGVADMTALEAADDRARLRLTDFSEEDVLQLLGECAVAFGAVTDD